MTIKSTVHQNYVTVNLNDPSTKNALGVKTAQDLAKTLQDTALGIGKHIRALILTATPIPSKQKADIWVSGGNLKELAAMNSEQAQSYVTSYIDIGKTLSSMSIPVICAIDGLAIGGGAELALWSDIRVMSQQSLICFKQTKVGLATGYGGCSRLVSLVGLSAAQNILLTGAEITSSEALRLGLVQRVCSSQTIHQTTLDIVEMISQNSYEGTKMQKQMLNLHTDAYSIARETEIFKSGWLNPEHEAFIKSFVEKNAPSNE